MWGGGCYNNKIVQCDNRLLENARTYIVNRLTSLFQRKPLVEGDFPQQDIKGGGARTWVLQNHPQFSLKDEQLVNQMRHESVVIDHLSEVSLNLGLYLLQKPTNKLYLGRYSNMTTIV